MTDVSVALPSSLDRAAAWLADFESALSSGDTALLSELLMPGVYWRDILAFGWDWRQVHGDVVPAELLAQSRFAEASGFVLHPELDSPVTNQILGEPAVELFMVFETKAGPARGYVLAKEDDAARHGMRAMILFTQLTDLRASPAHGREGRHPGLGFEPGHPGETWGEFRARQVAFADREPDVLVVGGAQAGTTVAAQLGQLGVDTLVVDRHENPGDTWRKRYESLALHSPTDMQDFPFFPFPKTFPKYLPKDKFADYIEAYVRLMDLNYWTSTEFLGAEFDYEQQTWTARVSRDGEHRELRPRHIVMAVGGAGGRPVRPVLPGLETFTGTVLHSSEFRSGAEFAGARAMVVGVGTSGHDIALALHHRGCTVQLLQRGSISVVDVEVANTAYREYTDPTISQLEADIRSLGRTHYPLQVETLRRYTEWTSEVNAELLAGLERAGMKLDLGEDGTGWLMKFHRYAGGYYLNVGASEFVVSGDIGLVPFESVEKFVPTGVLTTDGVLHELDLVVLATGYENLSVEVEHLFGHEVADRVGRIGGFGPDGERRNFGRPTAQPNLWFMLGGIAEGRRAGSALALQLAANVMGVAPTVVRGPDGRVVPLAPGEVASGGGDVPVA